MVWDGLLPGEQESVKIIRGENDWIIWRVEPPRGEPGDQAGENVCSGSFFSTSTL